MQSREAMMIRPAGDHALVVEFDLRIDRSVNNSVLDLFDAIRKAGWRDIKGMVPSYRSLLIYYDPVQAAFSEIEHRIRGLLRQTQTVKRRVKRWNLPVCYEPVRAPDLNTYAEKVGLGVSDVVQIHSSIEYMVYMIGFSPGFAYLGELPKALEVQRKEVPVAHVPANAVQVGGQQTAVSSMPMPSGWYVVGQTPVPMFVPGRAHPFLLDGGDLVSFTPIANAEFERLSELASHDRFEPKWEWVA